MRLIPLVLAALLVLLTSPARGAVATGEAPPQRELSPDLLVLLLGPPRAELDAQLAAGPEGLQGPGRASKERSPLPAWVLLVLELDAQGDESWIPE
ncbi:MAG: hypothetical protein KDD47_21745, partial [Acidobacteria bacterium]|nr:hypothetical protein [Acidobacteriota bacterium]